MDSDEDNTLIITVSVVVGILVLISLACCYLVIKRKRNLKCLSCFSKLDPELDVNGRESSTVPISSLSYPRNDHGESGNSSGPSRESNFLTHAHAPTTTSHVENETRIGPAIKPLSIVNRPGISSQQKINQPGKDTPLHTVGSSQLKQSKVAIAPKVSKINQKTVSTNPNVIKLSESEWPSLPITPSAKLQPQRSNVPLAQPVQTQVIARKGKTKTDASAKVALFKNDNEHAINMTILIKQLYLRDDENPGETVQQVQNLILRCTSDVKDLISEGCSLIIGVDATPATQAGYCVNLRESTLQYYVVKRDDLPWVIHDSKNPSEFEMKNFMFALTVWKEEILSWKRVRIYTDNFAITKEKRYDHKNYGDRAFEVLSHFTNCEGVRVLNMHDMAINRFENLKHFGMYIQPADDLSRWRINEAIGFLCKLYGIARGNVRGTHCVDKVSKVKTTFKRF